jgi:hypothetical protein
MLVELAIARTPSQPQGQIRRFSPRRFVGRQGGKIFAMHDAA